MPHEVYIAHSEFCYLFLQLLLYGPRPDNYDSVFGPVTRLYQKVQAFVIPKNPDKQEKFWPKFFTPILQSLRLRLRIAGFVQASMERRRKQHRYFCAHFVEQLQNRLAAARLEVAVHQHIEQRKFDLPQGLQAALEIPVSYT